MKKISSSLPVLMTEEQSLFFQGWQDLLASSYELALSIPPLSD
jgi:hypothetical protein